MYPLLIAGAAAAAAGITALIEALGESARTDDDLECILRRLDAATDDYQRLRLKAASAARQRPHLAPRIETALDPARRAYIDNLDGIIIEALNAGTMGGKDA